MENSNFKNQLLSAIVADPNRAFGEFAFRFNAHHKGGQWTSQIHFNRRRSKSGIGVYIDDGRNSNQPVMLFDESGGESHKIINYWEEKSGEKWPWPRLCELYGVEPPQRDPQAVEKEKKRQTETEKLKKQIREDYLGYAGADVRAYLSRPIEEGGRGYDEKTVIAMADYIGVITEQTAERLSELTGLSIPKNVGNKYQIVVPTIDKNGGIEYVKFRSITPGAKGADKWHNPAKDKSGGVGRNDVELYNYNNASFLALNRPRKLVIMESEICAAHSTVKGIKNAVALRGASSGIPARIVQRAKREGCRQIVVIFDNETDTEKRAKIVKDTFKLIRDIRNAADIDILVGNINPEWNVKDPDELLATYPDGANKLQSVIDNAEIAVKWETRQYAERYNNADNDSARLDAERDIAKQISELKDFGGLVARDADKMAAYWVETTGSDIKPETLIAAAEHTVREKDTENYNRSRDNLYRELQTARESKDTSKEYGILSELNAMRPPQDDPELRQSGRDADAMFDELYFDDEKNIETRFKIYARTPRSKVWETTPVVLDSNGITYVAGGTSNGKSTFLQNLAHDILSNTKDGQPKRRVLFYGFEETKGDTLSEFINIYIHSKIDCDDLSDKGNARAINDFFKWKTPDVFMTGQKWNNDSREYVKLNENDRDRIAAAIHEFMREYRGAGDGEQRLFIYDDALTSAELVKHIAQVAPIVRPDAIFIDYIQYLQSNPDDVAAQQWEDLGRVSKDLITINKTYNVPVVVAAQVKEKNNDTHPNKLSHTDIFGASSIAQGASSIYIVANSAAYSDDTTIKYCGEEEHPFGKEHKMVIKKVKGRHGVRNGIVLYDYFGGIRYINPDNYDKPSEIYDNTNNTGNTKRSFKQ